MRAYVHHWVHSCEKCTKNPPFPYATLFQVQANPKWGQIIVKYMQKKEFLKAMNTQRRKALKTKAMDFTILGQHLYKKGKDCQL